MLIGEQISRREGVEVKLRSVKQAQVFVRLGDAAGILVRAFKHPGFVGRAQA